jgi:hypothetical protein
MVIEPITIADMTTALAASLSRLRMIRWLREASV